MFSKLLTPLEEPIWHWKSLAVYTAGILYAIDIPLQFFVYQSLWEGINSVLITTLLASESYYRLAQKNTLFGANFAPIFSILLIVMYALMYWVFPT